jgi:heme/copper-type cytochrome/quinol oxidase subunit 1
VPTGIKLFNWIGTLWGDAIRLQTPMLFCLAFLFQCLCAGLTGVMLAVAPFNWPGPGCECGRAGNASGGQAPRLDA